MLFTNSGFQSWKNGMICPEGRMGQLFKASNMHDFQGYVIPQSWAHWHQYDSYDKYTCFNWSKQATAWVNDIQTWFLYDFVKCDRFLSYFMAATCIHKSMMSDFKIGFRNLRSVACMFSGQLRTVGREILPTRRVFVGGVWNFERIWSSTKIKQTQMMPCRHHHKSIGWLLWIPWAHHFMIQLRFPKALALSKVSRCLFLSGNLPMVHRSSQPAVPI